MIDINRTDTIDAEVEMRAEIGSTSGTEIGLMGHIEDTDPKKDATKSIQGATKDRELIGINISVDQIGVALPTIIDAGNILETEITIGGIEETRYFQMNPRFDLTALSTLAFTTS